ncbi:glycosyltransferase family 2 protein [Actinoplanes sp. TRM 88003]|uniref:4,4'-diaponeurosporenoate glycosyltransferase n=1 Tax=Paractinoplanes aksuensis TaxID=2939490 RepID=A0ABT1DVK2_9ACTN|nr:glycosyltransferase family A protein [Actinoplanes aksuensis]MCO8274879.1 glycosyltransferase family 2 protein [Actinoplanes aksuensis]
MNHRIAVVVPAHNEHDLLPACLSSLYAATSPVPVEIVVVADACTDDTAALAAAAGATVITTDARNVGRARAAGMEHALRAGTDGLWLATTDADSRVAPEWLLWHLTHAASGADLLAGTVLVDDWAAWPAALPGLYDSQYATTDAHVHGANLGIAAATYRAVGGFRPLAHDEDRDLITRVRATGAHVVADATCPVVTSARADGRAPLGFSSHLTGLASTLAA